MRSIEEYMVHWQARTIDDARGDEALRDRALREARHLAGVLAEVYGARKVYLFGSLARGGDFTEASDIDLAVEGLPEGCFYEALGDLLCRSTFNIDIKPVEDASELLRSRIARESIVLYE